VELKTGETIQGVLKEVNGTKVVIEVGGQSIAFERAKVKAFYVGTPPATPSGKVTTNLPGPPAIPTIRLERRFFRGPCGCGGWI